MRNYKKGIVSILPILIAGSLIVLGVIIVSSKVKFDILLEIEKFKSDPVLEETSTTQRINSNVSRWTNLSPTTKPGIVKNSEKSQAVIADYKALEIKQYGYTIFTAIISDNPVQDFHKYQDQIIPYLVEIKFPRALIENSVFIIFDNNFKGKTLNVNQGIYDLSMLTNFIISQDKFGSFLLFSNDRMFITIKSIALPSKFYPVLTHELGHLIWQVMTSTEKEEWSKIRGEPVRTDPYRNWTNWELSRNEDFAEVFKYLYGQHKNDDVTWEMNTAYKTRDCKSYYTTEELDELFKDPGEFYRLMSTYPYPCYKNEPPDDQTKDFMKKILNRLL